jgi:hypothetical protein
VECKFYGTTHRDDALVGRDTVIAVFHITQVGEGGYEVVKIVL